VSLAFFLFALLAPAEEEPPIAVLDVRPLSLRARSKTDLDLLPEAARLSVRLRESIAEATGRRVLSQAELTAVLGPLHRVRVFECGEQARCLRPLLAKLARVGVRVAFVGTAEPDRDKFGIELYRFDMARGAITKIVILEARRNGVMDLDAVSRIVGPLVGSPPPTQTQTQTQTRTETQTQTPTPTKPPPTTAEEPATGDVTETISQEATPSAPPPVPDRLQLVGWARSSMEIGLKDQGYHGGAPDPYAVPYNPLVARQQLYLHMRYARGRWFEAVASGLIAHTLEEQPTYVPTEPFNGFNGQSTQTTFETSVREVFVGLFAESVDFRVGLQRIAWGRGDIISPNDVLNARDLRDPMLAETEAQHIPTFALRTDIDFGGGTSLQLVVQPFFEPDRIDVYGTNWAVVQPALEPRQLRAFMGLMTRLVDPNQLEQLQPVLAQSTLPARDGSDSSFGARFSWTAPHLDVAHYYHYGFDTLPQITIDPMFAQQLMDIDFSMAKPSDLAPILTLLDMGRHPFDSHFVRRHHIGTDLVTTFDSFALRLDAAYDSNRVFYTTSLQSITSDSLTGVISLEYQTGDVGKLLLVEAALQHLGQIPPPLLGYTQDTFGVAMVARWTWAEHFETEMRAFLGAQPFMYSLRPQIGWKWTSFALRAGLVLLGGDPYSFGDYFSRNNSAYVIAKYSL